MWCYTFSVRVLEILGRDEPARVNRVSSGERNAILKARLRNVGIKNSECPDDCGVRIGKNRNSNSEAAREVDEDLGPVICDYSYTQSEPLIFWQCLSQLDQLGLAPRSPIYGTIEKQHETLRSFK